MLTTARRLIISLNILVCPLVRCTLSNSFVRDRCSNEMTYFLNSAHPIRFADCKDARMYETGREEMNFMPTLSK